MKGEPDNMTRQVRARFDNALPPIPQSIDHRGEIPQASPPAIAGRRASACRIRIHIICPIDMDEFSLA